MRLQTLKGFRDFLPEQARKRQYVIDTLKSVFESYGFEPLETPALEYEDILMGKYGEEGDKLMYRFEDNGGRKVAMRYDQTVPLARVVAQYPDLPKPFKRYQIQPVWRAENPQKGRYREFLQCDIDTVGVSSPLADAEIVACALAGVRKLGFSGLVMKLNDRKIFGDTEAKYLVTLDKMPKIGRDKTLEELENRGMQTQEAEEFIKKFESAKPTDNLQSVFAYLESMGLEKGQDFEFNPLIVRGLDYYTGTIFELVSKDNPSLSLLGGGRYDNLVGMFTDKQVPSVGFGMGFDRIVETMEDKNLFPSEASSSISKVLVTVFKLELAQNSLKVANTLRGKGVNVEVYPDENAKLDKQLKYADKRGIPYVLIIGEEEAKEGVVTLKNMREKKQEKLSLKKVIEALK